jgi:TonB-linked SusC/RagA family outer membrane protein
MGDTRPTGTKYTFKGQAKRPLQRITLYSLLCSFFLLASGFSQQLMLSMKEAKLTDIFKKIEQQTQYTFFYDNLVLKDARPVTIEYSGGNVHQLMEEVLRDQPFTYAIQRKKILIKKKKGGSILRQEKSFSSPTAFKTATPEVPRLNLAEQRANLLQESLERKVTGTVSDASGVNLPGVNIQIKGTQRGTTTDANGFFTIDVDDDATLVFSFVGYNPEETTVGSRRIINITLKEDQKALEEVIVVGYGTVRKSDLTGSVATIKGDAIREMPVTSVDQAIQSRVPGVQVTQTSSAPGGGMSIRVRGANSINSGSEPLYVIDGFPMYPDNDAMGLGGNRRAVNVMATINPNEIESIEILKDASATSIYGSRGANGVVLITTRRGKEGQARVDYDGSYSFQTIARPIEVLNGADYARYINTLEKSQGGSGRYSDAQIAEIGAGTNWWDAVSRTGGLSNHQLSFTGGTNSTRYAFVANYSDNKGIVKNTWFKRYGFRLNLDNDFLNGKATLTNSWSYNRTGNSNVPTDRGGPGGIIINSLGLDPTVSVYDANGNYNYASYDQRFLTNPLAEAIHGHDRDNLNRLFGTTALTFKLFEGLKFRTSIGADVVQGQRTTFYNNFTFTGRQNGRQLESANRNMGNILNENILTYNKAFGGKHFIDLTAGYTYQKEINRYSYAGTRGLPSDDVNSVNLQNGSILLVPSSSRTEWDLLSYLGRVNYNYGDKYLLTLTLRRDGSSKFGPNNKWATFPSAALGWRVINEDFLQNSSLSNVFSDLKFRASYGITGNSQIPVYRSLSGLVTYNYVLNGALVAGYGPNRIANPDLKWETTGMLNLGLDMAFLNNRLSLTVDVFQNKTKDLLLDVSIPQSTGFSTIMLNSGSLSNKGLEFSGNYKLLDKAKLQWDIGGNFSILRNKIDDLGMSTPFFAGSTSSHLGVFGSWVEAGQPIGVWRGYKYDGLFQSDEEGRQYSARAGYPKYVDTDNNGAYTTNDYQIIGDPNPDFIWGFNTSLKYGGFDLGIFLRGVHGNDVRNLQQSEMGDGVQKINQIGTILTDSWTPQNPNATRPVIDGRRDFISFRRSSYFIEDGSFIRLQNISLGYLLPVKSKFIRSARLYASGQNLFLITKYTGFDPEVNNQGQNNLNRGDDYDAYPRARMFTFGINLGI